MKNKSLSIIAILATGIFFLLNTTGCTVKQVQGVNRSIAVTGTGIVSVIPDRATIVLSVETAHKDILSASNENAQKMTAVQSALIETGIVSEDVTTSNYTINQDVSWNNGKKIIGDYHVSNQIIAVVRDISTIGKVIDKAISTGANELSSITFGLSDSEKILKQARILAIKNAEETATLLANTSGAVLGKVISITEDNDSSSRAFPMLAKSSVVSNDMISTPISAGKKDITVVVHVTYTLQ
ncbi:MAG: SIMPL domain-containing protein [Treponema sp.]|nr:SIMPL domain-containing protein [Treponema sp.]